MLIDYDFLKNRVVGPAIRHYADLMVTGLENIPKTGGVIFAPRHEAIIDTFLVGTLIERPTQSLAKVEYFTTKGLKGVVMREFFTRSQAIPLDRSNPVSAKKTVDECLIILKNGGSLIIHPEGGRSIDGRVYRATLSFIDMAFYSGAVIVPVAITGTRQVNPIGDRRLHRGPVTVAFLKPIKITTHVTEHLPMLLKRHIAKTIMTDIAEASKAEYVDIDLKRVKEALSRDAD